MSRNGKTKIRYLTVDEMLARIEELRARRAAESTAIEEPPDYVAGFELWAQAEAESAAQRIASSAPRPQLGATEVVGDEFVWIGDDLAIRLSPADLPEADGIEEAAALAVAADQAQTPAPRNRPWHAIPAGMLTRWNAERYALGAVAAGILALIIGGTALRIAPERRGTPMVASTYDLQAGRVPMHEFQNPDALEPLTPTAEFKPVEARYVRRIHPAAVEAKIKTALARGGFHDVGVSAGREGDVYLAANVYNWHEVRSIMWIARHAVRAARVYFPHPTVTPVQGPAYFGAYAEYDPSVWGAKISYVTIGSPAFLAGVRPGDIIREFDHHSVTDAQDLREAVAEHHPGDRIEIRVWRNGENLFTIARLGDHQVTEMAMR